MNLHELASKIEETQLDPGGLRDVHGLLEACNRIIFIGNGGSAAIASHMAADWLKNGKKATLCFNDPASLTCISNDLGYQNVFAVPLSRHLQKGDLLIAISSSGESRNIILAVDFALAHSIPVITLSGFEKDNALRSRGDINFYVPSTKYGIVEVAHHAILHSLLDKYLENLVH